MTDGKSKTGGKQGKQKKGSGTVEKRKNEKKGKLIKICGMTCEKDIEYANAYEPDFVGFILFFPKSKRNLSLEKAEGLREKLKKSIQSVAVTVSPTIEQIEGIEKAGFDYLQVHGTLDGEVYEKIRLPILRAFNVTDLEAFDKMKCLEKIKGYVFDAKTPGSGEIFDWKLLHNIERDGKMFFLAGGIDETNVMEAIRQVNPDGIDVSSAVENPDVFYNETCTNNGCRASGQDQMTKKPTGFCGGKNKEKMKKIIRMVHDEK